MPDCKFISILKNDTKITLLEDIIWLFVALNDPMSLGLVKIFEYFFLLEGLPSGYDFQYRTHQVDKVTLSMTVLVGMNFPLPSSFFISQTAVA